MPTYVYKFVDSGETIEVHQGFHDDSLTEIAHPDTGVVMPVKKVFTPVGVTFKGSGFFKTDNRGKKSSTSTSSNSSDTSKDSTSSSSDAGSSSGSTSGSSGTKSESPGTSSASSNGSSSGSSSSNGSSGTS